MLPWSGKQRDVYYVGRASRLPSSSIGILPPPRLIDTYNDMSKPTSK